LGNNSSEGKVIMKQRNWTTKNVLAVVGVVAMAATAAQASILTEYVDVTPSSSGGSGLTFSLPTFDPSLGTLNSVELTLTPVLGNFGNQALNLSANPVLVSLATEAISGTGSLNNSTLLMSATYYTTSGTLLSPDFTAAPGLFVLTDGPGLPFVWTIADSSAGVTAAGYAALGGSLVFTGSNPSFASSGSDGVYAIGSYGNVGGDLEVDFNYTAVPEPTTILAGVLTLLPFGASGLRILRKRQAA
jgi:hypothetical protein